MPPPGDLSQPPSKNVRLVISSADRNLSLHPSPNNYVLQFDEPYTDVVSLQLLSACLPLVAYQVQPSNSKVAFRSDATTHEASIPVGDYEPPTALAEALAAAMNGACGDPGRFTVTYSARTDNFELSSTAPFALLFDGGQEPFGPQLQDEFTSVTPQGLVERLEVAGERSVTYAKDCAARIMGFGASNHASTQEGPRHVLRSPYRRNASHANVAVVCLDGADVNVSANNAFNRSFAVIGPRQAGLEAWLPDRGIQKGYNPPVGKLGRLRVRILDVNGSPYDCQNHDHRFELLLKCAPRFQARPNWTVRAD